MRQDSLRKVWWARLVPPPAPPPTVTVTLVATRDTINASLVPTGHWSRVTAVVRSGTTVLPISTNAELVWSVSDSASVTEVREAPSTFEIHSPTRSGTNVITARWAATGTMATKTIVMVGPATAPPPPIDTTTPAPPPPTGASVAELPRVTLHIPYPTTTRVVHVTATGLTSNLQAALNAAQAGDDIVLECGATWTGNFTLPARSGGMVVVRSACLSQLPPMGSRVNPSHASLMPKLVTPNTDAALKTVGASNGWWLAGLEVTVSPSVTIQNYGLLLLGGNQTTVAAGPSDIVLDRLYVHGQTTTKLSRCIALNSARTVVRDSYVDECHIKGFDSQALWSSNGAGPFLIENNTLRGAGENLMFGGADAATPGLVPADIVIRRNLIQTPASWKGVWTKKNLLELKNATRVLIEGNVLDGSWADGQSGEAFVFKSTNQSGACRWCRTTDVTVRRNLAINIGSGMSLIARDAQNVVDTTLRRVVFSENVFDGIHAAPFTGNARGMSIYGVRDVSIEKTVVTGSLSSIVFFEQLSANCRFTDNQMVRGTYAVLGTGVSGLTNTLAAFCPGAVWAGNVLHTGTTFSTAEADAIRAIVQQATAGVITP
jgi:hypothetical protein